MVDFGCEHIGFQSSFIYIAIILRTELDYSSAEANLLIDYNYSMPSRTISQSSPRPLFPVQWTSVPSASHGHPQVLTSGSLAVAITSSRNKALRHRLIMMLVVIVMMFPSTAHVPVMIMPALVPPPLLRSTLERRKNRTDFIH
ncbi:hypothetical protein J6590_048412 [Homalodisca vitripennis]|nr:hypothetical protein J6590_048412 [Homalodisca vitripennis]